jgi:hypothetical protein
MIGTDAGALVGWPLQRWAKPECPVVFIAPVDAPHPGAEYVRVRITGAVAAMGVGPDNPNVFVRTDDPLLSLTEALEG